MGSDEIHRLGGHVQARLPRPGHDSPVPETHRPMHTCPAAFAQAPLGRQHHPANQRLTRHCHDSAFATVVLEGGYLEAGDEGRRTVGPGDVLVHHAYESHLDSFSKRGAQVLILPIASRFAAPLFGRVTDPDALVHIARHSPRDAWFALTADMQACEQQHMDWPDLLAEQLRHDPGLSLQQWAESYGLRPETVSRGFQLAYGSSPKAFRAAVRARAAFKCIRESRQPLVDIAATLGYADQAHMSRAVKALTGHMPRTWRADEDAGTTPCRSHASTGFKTAPQAAL